MITISGSMIIFVSILTTFVWDTFNGVAWLLTEISSGQKSNCNGQVMLVKIPAL